MCLLWPEARGWAKPSQAKPSRAKLGLIFGMRWLLAQPEQAGASSLGHGLKGWQQNSQRCLKAEFKIFFLVLYS